MLAEIVWHPNPDALDLGVLKIQWYGISWGLGLLAVYFIGTYVFRILKKDEEHIVMAIQYAFIGGLLGARIGHILFYQLDFYMAHPQKIIAVWEGGLASHGGMVGALIALLLFCHRYRSYSYLFMLDITAICIPLFCSLVRLGNLMNSELVGKITGSNYGFVFPGYGIEPRHPVVLYESIAYLTLQFVMLYLFKIYKDNKPASYSVVMLVGIFGLRFLIEFFKEPEGMIFFGTISKTQMLNVPFVLLGVAIFVLMRTRKLTYNT